MQRSRSPPSRSGRPPARRRDGSTSASGARPVRRRHGDSRSPRRPSSPRRSPGESPPRKARRHRRSPTRSPSGERPRRSRRPSPSPPSRRSRQALPSQEQSYRGDAVDAPAEPAPPPKEKPNYKPSGLLAAEANKVSVGGGKGAQSIVLKYHEPPEARKPPPRDAWSMFVFKGDSDTPLDTVQLHARSCWLLGREVSVADVLIEHPSCSKQHAVLQFRHVTKQDEWGEKKSKVGLYVLDLESANGTVLNGSEIGAARYVECRSGDVLKFGQSEREYVLLLAPK